MISIVRVLIKCRRQLLRRAVLFVALSLFSAPGLADYEAGLTAVQNGDFATAFREFTAAAEAGLDLAQYNLGVLYYTGQGVAQDYQQAFVWTNKAAEQGHMRAQFNLATLYFSGIGVEQDHATAFSWYERAARSGHGEAQFNLGTMYRDGDGVERNIVNAHAWATLALENEFSDAADLIRGLERRMDEEQLSDARRQFARIKVGF